MGSATVEGEGRALLAIEDAMSSPLLNDNDIRGAQNILLYIMTGAEDLTMDEITEITDYVQQECGNDNEADVIWGNGKDDSLGEKICITIIATGFNSKRKTIELKTKRIGTIGEETKPVETKTKNIEDKPSIEIKKEEKEIAIEVPVFGSSLHKNDNEESSGIHFVNKTDNEINPLKDKKPETTIKSTSFDNTDETKKHDTTQRNNTIFSFTSKKDKMPPGISHTISSDNLKEEEAQIIEEKNVAIKKTSKDRINKLKTLSQLRNPQEVGKMESEPAYVRKNIDLDSSSLSSESVVSRYTLGEDGDNNPIIKTDNTFLHDNVD